jgi:hypothetical protein
MWVDTVRMNGLVWLRRGKSGGLLWMRQWTFGFHEMLRSTWVAAKQLAFPVALCCTQLVITYTDKPRWFSRLSDWTTDGRVGNVKNFHFSAASRPDLGSTQPSIQCVPEASYPGIKRPGREANHSPTNDEIEEHGSIHIRLHGCEFK